MADKDDLLLREFLSAGRETLPDEGFSRRVLRRLPRKGHSRRQQSVPMPRFVAILVLVVVGCCCAELALILLLLSAKSPLFTIVDALDNMIKTFMDAEAHLVGYGQWAVCMVIAVLILLNYKPLARFID